MNTFKHLVLQQYLVLGGMYFAAYYFHVLKAHTDVLPQLAPRIPSRAKSRASPRANLGIPHLISKFPTPSCPANRIDRARRSLLVQVGAIVVADDICSPPQRRQLRPAGVSRAPLPPVAGMPGAAMAARSIVRGGGGLRGGQHRGGEVRDGADAGPVLRPASGLAGGFYYRGNAPDRGPQVRRIGKSGREHHFEDT